MGSKNEFKKPLLVNGDDEVGNAVGDGSGGGDCWPMPENIQKNDKKWLVIVVFCSVLSNCLLLVFGHRCLVGRILGLGLKL